MEDQRLRKAYDEACGALIEISRMEEDTSADLIIGVAVDTLLDLLKIWHEPDEESNPFVSENLERAIEPVAVNGGER